MGNGHWENTWLPFANSVLYFGSRLVRKCSPSLLFVCFFFFKRRYLCISISMYLAICISIYVSMYLYIYLSSEGGSLCMHNASKLAFYYLREG